MYYSIGVVVEGALEEEAIAMNDEELDEKIGEVAAMSADDGLPTEVWVLRHNHDLGPDDCACSQYVTRTHPYVTFNKAE